MATFSSYLSAETAPYVETLQYRQMQAHITAAPKGDDEPLREASILLDVATEAPDLDEDDSSFAEFAEAAAESPSLQEEVQTQALDEQLVQFGYDIFGQVPSTFVPVDNIPVPPNYLLGPGDTLVVQLYGKQNVEYQLVVTRDGNILVPEYGPITVSGLTFEEAKDVIVEGFSKRVIGAKAVVTMGSLRTIQITITGDVVRPGTYTVSGLSTLIDALLVTGGIKYSGSLRNIQVKHRGKVKTTFDLYDLLLVGDNEKDVALKHGDVVFVPPIEKVVYVGGEIQRPAIYELKNEKTIDDIVAMAGGLLPTASLRDSHIERIINNRFKTILNLSDVPNVNAVSVRSGDFLRVLPLDETLKQVVMLSGHVKRPGGYQFKTPMRVSDLLPRADLILPNADLDFALLVREQKGTKRAQIKYVNLAEVIRKPRSEYDFVLQARDELIILKLDAKREQELSGIVKKLEIQSTDYRPPLTVVLSGHFRFTGRMPLQKEARLLDVISIGGGIKRGTDMAYAVIGRTHFPEGHVEMTSYRLDSAIANPFSDQNPLIKAEDRVYLFNEDINRSVLMQRDLDQLVKQGSYLFDSRVVWANGLINKPGRYPLVDKMRASDLVCAANGLDLNAFGVHAELSRYEVFNGERREVEHIRLDTPELLRLCRERRIQSKQKSNVFVADKYQRYGELDIENNRYFLNNIIDPIRFDSGKALIRDDMLSSINRAINYIKSQGDDYIVHIEGHTDSQALSKQSQDLFVDNLGLSEARANTVGQFIAKRLSLGNTRFTAKGYGELRPVSDNTSPSGMAMNRRAEVKIEVLPQKQKQFDNNPVKSGMPKPFVDDSDIAAYFDDSINPLLKPYDQLTFVEKPAWVERALVTLSGEVERPGLYVIDRGETLCEVLERAGGTTERAYIFGADFTRKSIKALQQQTLNDIQDKLDDLHVDLSLSHTINNADKTPAGEHKQDYLRVMKQLKRAKVSGRMVVDLKRAERCDKKANIVMKDGDKLHVPVVPDYVHVTGQVYVPTSHMYRKNRTINDYIELSGDETVLGRKRDAYVIQANGEVISLSRWRSSARALKRKVKPGAQIYVPLDVDRINPTESAQSWSRALLETAILGGILL